MYKIVEKRELNSAVTLMKIEAPFIAKRHVPVSSSSSASMSRASVCP